MVLNWNGSDLLRRHLPAVIEAARATKADARVFVIDNASVDDSLTTLKSFEDVEVIGFRSNRRLHAYNDAVRVVDCDAFMMLNNDLSPSRNAVERLWSILRVETDVFAVGGDVVDVTTGAVESGPTAMRWERQWILEPTAFAGSTRPVDVAYVSGGAGLYRRSMFLELGGFWDALPGLYWEDVELGLHAWLHGWRSVFEPNVTFHHESGATIRRALNPRMREFRTYQNVRLTHAALTLNRADLLDYLRGELVRSVRKPYYYPAALTLTPMLARVVRRRRALRRRLGPVRVAELETKWGCSNASAGQTRLDVPGTRRYDG